MPLYVWNDLSPDDGCTLVRYAAMANSAHEVARHASTLPNAQNRSVPKLLKRASLRVAHDLDCPASSRPGSVFWQDDDGAWHQAL